VVGISLPQFPISPASVITEVGGGYGAYLHKIRNDSILIDPVDDQKSSALIEGVLTTYRSNPFVRYFASDLQIIHNRCLTLSSGQGHIKRIQKTLGEALRKHASLVRGQADIVIDLYAMMYADRTETDAHIDGIPDDLCDLWERTRAMISLLLRAPSSGTIVSTATGRIPCQIASPTYK